MAEPEQHQQIVVRDLTRSLKHIETWLETVRKVLCDLEPDMVIRTRYIDRDTWINRKPPPVRIGCPPPEGECEDEEEDKA